MFGVPIHFWGLLIAIAIITLAAAILQGNFLPFLFRRFKPDPHPYDQNDELS